MAMSQAAYAAEKAIGHDDTAVTQQDISNPAVDREKFADPSGERMKALVWMGKNKLEVQSVPKPRLLEPRDVILKVTGSSVCGSDLHLLHGAIAQLQKGDILGHEFCGVVESIGAEIKALKPGDRVVASFQIACGDCDYCMRKLSSQCERTNANSLAKGMYGTQPAGIFGYSHFTGGFAGGQAEYVRVPYGDVNLLPIPASVPDEKALYLSDVLATSWHCVVDTGVRPGDVVAVWGAGPIGQMAAAFARRRGAARVIVVDANWRLGFVETKHPEVETLDYSKLPGGTGVSGRLREMVTGGPDVCLECVGGEYAKGWAAYFEILLGMETDSSEVVNEMLTSVRGFGRCGISGVYAGYTNHFNIGALMERGVRLIGNGQAPVQMYWEELLGMVEKGDIDPLEMVTHRVRLEELAEVYERLDWREEGMQKVFVETRFSKPPAPGSPALTTYEK